MKPITTKALRACLVSVLTALCTVAGAQTESAKNAGPVNEPSPVPASSSPEPATSDDYVIGADDVLAINVWKEPDLTRTLPVRPDGKISLPLIGDIGASGSTPKQLQANIQERLSQYIAKPAVTVIVQESKSHRFNIVGEVQKPGSYLLTSKMTILDAIALAGGFRDWAKVKSIYVLRANTSGAPLKLAFNYKKVIKGDASGQNIQLRNGDTVVVP
jgi:polysaccharide export outer membrane protein